MPVYLSLSIVLVVLMGLTGGAMLALLLMSARKQQLPYLITLALSLLLALLGAGVSLQVEDRAVSFTNSVVVLILTFALGYAFTTLTVLLPRRAKREPTVPGGSGRWTAVICLASGEPADYELRSAARRLELADNTEDVPPLLLRPFYMRDIRSKFAAIGRSPYHDYMAELARKVQARLPTDQRVSVAFYSDRPGLADTVTRVIEEGTQRIVIAHIRVTDPPDAVAAGELLEGIDLDSNRVRANQLPPLWDSDLLPQIYVRRVLEAVAMGEARADQVGLLLVGRGHAATSERGRVRREQEQAFFDKLRLALLKAGFDESRIATGWLRQSLIAVNALQMLADAGCKSIYWMPASYPADGINTLYDIKYQLDALAAKKGIKVTGLGGWNADDLAAEEIAARVRAAFHSSPRAL